MFLEVKFHDNDFGWYLMNALARLWGYVNDNKRLLSVPPLFLKLNDSGALIPAIKRLWITEILAEMVNEATIMLDTEFANSDTFKLKISREEVVRWEKYLDFTIEFHNTKDFIEDQNGEHAYLDLRTGDVSTF